MESSSFSSSSLCLEFDEDHDVEYAGSAPLASPLCGSKREFCSRFGSHGQQLLLTVGFSSRTAHEYRKRRVNRGYPSQGYQGRSPCLVGYKKRRHREGEAPAEAHGAGTCRGDSSPGGSPSQVSGPTQPLQARPDKKEEEEIDSWTFQERPVKMIERYWWSKTVLRKLND